MAHFEQCSSFPQAASRALSLLLENTEMVALKEPTTVVSQVQRFHVALAEKVSLELALTHRDCRSQTVEYCCWACPVGVSMRPGGTVGARRVASIGPSGNCSDAVACRT